MIACVVAGATLLSLSGCAPGANDDLKAVVENTFLPGMDSTSCEWGSSSYENEPKSWYGCWAYVSGDVERVGDAMHSRLNSHGFDVSRNRTDFTVELTAVRNSETVCVDVLAPGFVAGRNTSPDEINPDPGEVFVDVWMAEPRDAQAGVCAELPAWDT